MIKNSPEDSDIILQKLPCDMGIHRNPRKGTLEAPEKILEDFKFDRKGLIDEVFPDEFDLEETQRRIEENTRELAEYDKPIVSIGGDHSVSYPVIKALWKENPGMKLVWLDAHLDLKEKVDDHVSHDVVIRQLIDEGFPEESIFMVGFTKVDEDEKEFLEESDFNIYSAEEVEKFKREFEPDEQPVYLSVDIDVMNKESAPGTGYPDGDLDLKQVKNVIDTVNPEFADLVEVAPPLEREGKTVSSAREILKRILNNISR